MILKKSLRSSLLATSMALIGFGAHASEISVSEGGSAAFLAANPDAVEVAPATYKVVRDGRSMVVAFGDEAIEGQLHAMEQRIASLEGLAGAAKSSPNSELNVLKRQRDQLIVNLAADDLQAGLAKVRDRQNGSSCGASLTVEWETSYWGMRYYVLSSAVAHYAEFGPPSGIPKSGYVTVWGAGDNGAQGFEDNQPFTLSGQAEWGTLSLSAQGGPGFCPTAGFVGGLSGPRQNNCQRVFLRGYDGGPCNIPDPLGGHY